ncbi:hypothetical protein HMPREF0591_4798 [Mycobacterium parascrofulaceum ATCC BAA-614]|uniref:Uncharacterized protein n=1 Tax=Mycobacterium parascrofulaceum ATCC BAA-614 TaxID=525368 RepID=D5PF54_9MYCO|nr:hypothetical protein [Mycobacterium parascrofulaceum]EFG75298.1 hypothetical protein HMPREF0591_4798 [Mycobacterium parascrofulaceum ATCC BAA-614]
MTDIRTDWVDNIGETVDADYLNGLGSNLNANTHARTVCGNRSARPAAAPENSGGTYRCLDCNAEYLSNGSAWSKIRIGGHAGPPMADPPSSGLTTTPMGSAALTADRDGRLLSMPASDGNWRVEYKALSPTSGYTATAFVEVPELGSNALLAGLILLSSSGTNLLGFGPGNNGAFGAFVFGANALSGITSTRGSNTTLLGVPNWYRIRDDGTNLNFEYSLNGLEWRSVLSESRTAALTPAYIGWGGINTGGSARVARMRSLAITTP